MKAGESAFFEALGFGIQSTIPEPGPGESNGVLGTETKVWYIRYKVKYKTGSLIIDYYFSLILSTTIIVSY